MNYLILVEQIRHHVSTYYATHPHPKLHYHELQHTESVVSMTREISNYYQLHDRDFFIVLAAAWFHDIGYLESSDHHEAKSAQMAADFLSSIRVDEKLIREVQSTIKATKMPQNPTNLLERIVCDADLYHLGTHDFGKQTMLMRKEKEALTDTSISKHDWRKQTITLLETHRYHTDYCQKKLNATKQHNLEKLQHKEHGKAPDGKEADPDDSGVRKSSRKSEKNKDERPTRGIETMFRISSTNHQRLSDLADNKANIMISVNAIILSVIISVLIRRLEEYPHFSVPSYLLLAVNVITLIFAVLATRPSIPNGLFSQQEVDEKKVNLLFFGNFYRMSLDDYTSGMLRMMEDGDFLYRSLIKDVYSQGVVLGKKYRLLRVAYNVFMYGIIISVLGFIIASVINEKSI